MTAGSVSSGTSILRTASYRSRLVLTPDSAMSRCLSDSSMPITFSVCSRSLFLIRLDVGDGVGDWMGDGEGVGEAVCASALRGAFEAAITAAPAAGRTFTKVRRSIDLRLCFFMALERRHPCRRFAGILPA